MRSTIDKFVAALLNEERETASELLRQYIIAKAQDIHEGLRQGDHPVLAEDINEDIVSETYFTDEDLADDEEVSTDDAADSLGDDMGAHADAGDDAEADADFSADDADADVDADAEDTEGSEGDVDDRLDDLESQLDELTAEFERMMAEIDGEGSDDDDVLGADSEVETDVDGDSEESTMEESLDHEDFDDISEAIIDELEKIKTVNTDGREAGNKTITQNGKSLPTVRDKVAGHPIKTKNVTHKGFERETAPSSDRLPKGRNTQDHADSKLKPVSKEGDASAEINKPVKQNNVSPVAKLKK